jgi:TnpA family transposase
LVYSTFNVERFEQIELATQTMAPSMIEYYLSDLASSSEEESSYINKSEIQNTVYLDEYMLYTDYSNNIYLEFTEKNDDYETESLW